jgi:hypothetical protein
VRCCRERDPSGHLPRIAPRILDHRPAISVGLVARRLDRTGTRGDGTTIRSIGVVDVNIEKRRRGSASAVVVDHDDGITNAKLRGAVVSIGACCAKHSLDECEQPLRIASEESGRDDRPASWCERSVASSLHSIAPPPNVSTGTPSDVTIASIPSTSRRPPPPTTLHAGVARRSRRRSPRRRYQRAPPSTVWLCRSSP